MYKKQFFVILLNLTIVKFSVHSDWNYYFAVLGFGPYEEQMSMSRGAATRRKQ